MAAEIYIAPGKQSFARADDSSVSLVTTDYVKAILPATASPSILATTTTAGLPEALALGTNLSVTSGILNAAGGSGSVTLTGDVTGSGAGSVATTVAGMTGATIVTPEQFGAPGFDGNAHPCGLPTYAALAAAHPWAAIAGWGLANTTFTTLMDTPSGTTAGTVIQVVGGLFPVPVKGFVATAAGIPSATTLSAVTKVYQECGGQGSTPGLPPVFGIALSAATTADIPAGSTITLQIADSMVAAIDLNYVALIDAAYSLRLTGGTLRTPAGTALMSYEPVLPVSSAGGRQIRVEGPSNGATILQYANTFPPFAFTGWRPDTFSGLTGGTPVWVSGFQIVSKYSTIASGSFGSGSHSASLLAAPNGQVIGHGFNAERFQATGGLACDIYLTGDHAQARDFWVGNGRYGIYSGFRQAEGNEKINNGVFGSHPAALLGIAWGGQINYGEFQFITESNCANSKLHEACPYPAWTNGATVVAGQRVYVPSTGGGAGAVIIYDAGGTTGGTAPTGTSLTVGANTDGTATYHVILFEQNVAFANCKIDNWPSEAVGSKGFISLAAVAGQPGGGYFNNKHVMSPVSFQNGNNNVDNDQSAAGAYYFGGNVVGNEWDVLSYLADGNSIAGTGNNALSGCVVRIVNGNAQDNNFGAMEPFLKLMSAALPFMNADGSTCFNNLITDYAGMTRYEVVNIPSSVGAISVGQLAYGASTGPYDYSLTQINGQQMAAGVAMTATAGGAHASCVILRYGRQNFASNATLVTAKATGVSFAVGDIAYISTSAPNTVTTIAGGGTIAFGRVLQAANSAATSVPLFIFGESSGVASLALPSGATGATQAAGDNSTNLATTAYVNAAVANAATIATTGGSTTLTAAQYGLPIAIVTGTLTTPAQLVVPNAGKWRVINRTNNAYPVVVTTAAGTGFAVPNGNAGFDIVADGTNVVPTSIPAPRGYTTAKLFRGVPLWAPRGLNQSNASTANALLGGTARENFQAPYAMHDISALFANLYEPGGEGAPSNPVTFCATLEYPANTFYNFTIPGKTPLFVNSAKQAFYTLAPYEISETLPVSLDLPASALPWVRTFVVTSQPPAVGTPSTSTSSGALTAGTYYYKVTQLGGAQGESGPSSEVSGTIGSTGQITLAWVPNPNSVPPTGWNIYRTEIATGDERYLTTLPPGTLTFVDIGAISSPAVTAGTGGVSSATLTVATNASGFNIAIGNQVAYFDGTNWHATTITAVPATGAQTGTFTMAAAQMIPTSSTVYFGGVPPAAQTFPVGPNCGGATPPGFAEGNNYSAGGGNGTNQTLTSGTGWQFGSGGQYGFCPIALMGIPDQGLNVPLAELHGDSIGMGVNQYDGQGWFGLACQNAGNAYWQNARNGASLIGSWQTAGGHSMRGLFQSAATDVLCQFGTNDITGSLVSLATLQAAVLTDAVSVKKRRSASGAPVRYWLPTILPRTPVSTDSWATAGNQLVQGLAITGASNASPIELTFGSVHGFTNGQPTTVAGVGGNTAANGSWYVNVIDSSHVTLYSNSGLTTPSTGNGAWTSGGGASRPQVDAVRTGYNAWVVAGCPVTSATNITAVAIGTSGALLAGQPGHPVDVTFDITTNVEVNASNVLTLAGGYWISNGTANYYVSDGTHPLAHACPLIAPNVPTSLMVSP